MTDVTPEMLSPSNTTNHKMELKKFGRKEQDDEGVVNQNNQIEDRVNVKQKKVDIKLEVKEDIKLEVKEHLKLERKNDLNLGKEDLMLEKKEDLMLEKKEDLKLEKKEDSKMEKEDLKLKESVAALSVKSDSNFVQWQKSFGKHNDDGSKKRNREGETKEERRERKEKRRMERKEAERREAKRWEEEEKQNEVRSGVKNEIKSEIKKEEVRSGGCNNNEMKKSKQVPAKPLFSLMMQELDNPSSCLVTGGGEDESRKVKKEESDEEYSDLPEPVYACKPECQCSFHF